MEVHKPKPWHGLRGFLKEYLIIVVGVLTALGAEQVVEWLHWTERTHQAREHMAAELHDAAVAALGRQAIQPCVVEMMDAVEKAVAQSGDDWRPPFVITFPGAFGRGVIGAPKGVWATQAWQNARADGTANHLSRADTMAFGGAYDLVARTNTFNDQEAAAMAELNALAWPQRFDPASRASYLREIARARENLFLMNLASGEVLKRAKELGVRAPQLSEYGPALANYQSVCRQFKEGRAEILIG